MGHGIRSQAFASRDRQLAAGRAVSWAWQKCRLLVDRDQCTILFLSASRLPTLPTRLFPLIKSPLHDSNRAQLCPTLDTIRYPAGLLPPPPSARRSLFQPHRTRHRRRTCSCENPSHAGLLRLIIRSSVAPRHHLKVATIYLAPDRRKNRGAVIRSGRDPMMLRYSFTPLR